MNNREFELAARVVDGSDRRHPADAVLRRVFREAAPLPPETRRHVAEDVFAYYRWLGWLNQRASLRRQFEDAAAHDRRFRDQPKSFRDDELIRRAVPGWVADEMEVSAEWARTLQSVPRLWLRAKRGAGKEVAEKLGDCRIVPLGGHEETLLYEGDQDLFRTESFQRGEFELQDLSSQAASLLCHPRPGETWWDACTGEGGKLLHLSELMENRGRIWASDRAEWRLQKLKRRAARAGAFNYRVATWDGGEVLPTKTRFDGVLVDAPCSGIGTWQRNPQARWVTRPEDVSEMAQLQRRLLKHAAPSVKPGGKLVYSVCSLSRSETIEVAEAFASACPEFRPWQVERLAQSGEAGARHWFQPEILACNGMFVALWKRDG